MEDSSTERAASIPVPVGDRKPAARENCKYYVVLNSESLRAPAIFLNFEDCSVYIDQEDNDSSVTYKEFDKLEDAGDYIKKFARGEKISDVTPPSKKRSAQAASLSTEGAKPHKRTPRKSNKSQEQWKRSLGEMKEKLKNYKQKYGTCDVPRQTSKLEPEFNDLGKWVHKTRQLVKEYQESPDSSFLTDADVSGLLDVGFATEIKRGVKFSKVDFDERWDGMIVTLKEYKNIYGHCEVPRGKQLDEKYYPLQKWVSRMRKQIRDFEENPDSSFLDEERIKVLTDIGFVKNVKRGAKGTRFNEAEPLEFERMIEELKEFKEKNLPIKSNNKLQSWIAKQRKEYQEFKDGKPSTMTAQRIVQLAEHGFTFQPKQKCTWDERAVQWLEYRSKNGKDPKRYSEDGLGKWVCSQRAKYKTMQRGEKTNLTEEQVKRLTEWGFSWESKIKIPTTIAKKQPWENRFEQLIEYKEKYGHCLVPQQTPELGQWVHSQRNNYKKFLRGEKCGMTKEKVTKLKSIGFVFDTGKGGGKRLPVSVARKADIDLTANETFDTGDDSEEEEDLRMVPTHMAQQQRQTNPRHHFHQESLIMGWDRYNPNFTGKH